jgi:hypothetical protein
MALNRNEYQEYCLGGKGDRCVGLITLPPSCVDCLEIWKPPPPGTLRAYLGLYRDCFTIIYCFLQVNPFLFQASSFSIFSILLPHYFPPCLNCCLASLLSFPLCFQPLDKFKCAGVHACMYVCSLCIQACMYIHILTHLRKHTAKINIQFKTSV